jgi:hypothetical protein
MSKKLKRALVRLGVWFLGFFWILVTIESLGGLIPSGLLAMFNVIAWAVFIIGLVGQGWTIYCGMYRDGTFYIDETDEY